MYNSMNEERSSGENLRGLGLLVLYLFTVTSAEDVQVKERDRECKRYSHKWLL